MFLFLQSSIFWRRINRKYDFTYQVNNDWRYQLLFQYYLSFVFPLLLLFPPNRETNFSLCFSNRENAKEEEHRPYFVTMKQKQKNYYYQLLLFFYRFIKSHYYLNWKTKQKNKLPNFAFFVLNRAKNIFLPFTYIYYYFFDATFAIFFSRKNNPE